jgi:hypothetical protein
MRDLADLIFHAMSLSPVARVNGTFNGTAVDLSQFNRCEAVIIPGSWTDGTHTIKLQDSDDNVTFTDVAATDLNKYDNSPVPITSAGTMVLQKIGYIGIRRYIRAVDTTTGATTGAVFAVMFVLGDYKHYGFTPVQTPAAIV